MRKHLLAALFLLAMTPQLHAQEPAEAKAPLPDDAIRFSKPKAAVYDKLFIFDKKNLSGAGREAKSDKFRFLHLRVMVNYQLPADAETIHVRSDDIRLIQDGGEQHPSVGSFSNDMIFSTWPDNIWLNSSRSRRNEAMDIVYAIPADATGPFALKIGDLKMLRVELPKQVVNPPHPADMVKVEIKSIAWGNSVPGEPMRIKDKEIPTTFSVPGRRLLAVSMLVHAQDYNDNEGKQLNWNGDALSIRDPQGNVYPTHGTYYRERINHNVGHSSEVGKKSTESQTFFFSPPDDIASFELLWYGRPVTTHQVKK